MTCEFPPRPRRPARRATAPRRRRWLDNNPLTGTFPLALCDVRPCRANSGNDLVAPCGSTNCCDLGDGALVDDGAVCDACRDLWSAAGLPAEKEVQVQGYQYQIIFTADELDELALLEGDVDEKIAMSFEATSACSQDIELGFSGGGGWLKVTVKQGMHTYAVEDDRKKGPTNARYEIRTAGCEGTITLDLIKYTNCAAQSDNSSNDDGNGSSKGASLAIIIPVVVAAVLLLAAILFLVRKRAIAARQPHRDTSMPYVGDGDEAEA